MGNATDKLSTSSRAMIAGAMLGGGASVSRNSGTYRNGKLPAVELVGKATRAAVQAGVVSGGTTYVAERMAGRPVLSMLTLLSLGAASLYLVDQLLEKSDHEQA